MNYEHDAGTHAINGCAMAVHAELGPGFLEAVYQETLATEFALKEVPFEREVQLPVFYRGLRLQTFYRADFIRYGCIVVDLKALKAMTGIEESIMINYLKATRMERGLLLNFGTPSLRINARCIHHERKDPPRGPRRPVSSVEIGEIGG